MKNQVALRHTFFKLLFRQEPPANEVHTARQHDNTIS
jgi:hypothetical protein